MEMRYHHTQVGHYVLVAIGIASLVIFGVVFLEGYHPVALVTLFFMLVCAILFGSLTVKIKENKLAWSFGPGLFHKSVRIDEIDRVSVVRNHWLYGWGIRITPHGWLYNVSGLSAIEVHLKSGKQFRLGTDQPEELAQALETAIVSSSA
jgi:hypothetical protein